MNKRALPIFLALSALILASMACAVGGKLNLANFRMAHDQDGKQTTSTFAPNDAIYSVADLSNAPKGTVVSSKWYAVSVEGQAPNTFIDDAEITTDQDSFSGTVHFFFPEGSNWPAGTYSVEWYLNDELIDTVTFSVQ